MNFLKALDVSSEMKKKNLIIDLKRIPGGYDSFSKLLRNYLNCGLLNDLWTSKGLFLF